MRHFGSFKILERLGSVRYRLDLPSDAKVHQVFHISILQKCEGDPDAQYISLLH